MCIWVFLGGIHEVIVKKLVNCTWQHLKLEAPVGTQATDCRIRNNDTYVKEVIQCIAMCKNEYSNENPQGKMGNL